jgi:hypothetical protein
MKHAAKDTLFLRQIKSFAGAGIAGAAGLYWAQIK